MTTRKNVIRKYYRNGNTKEIYSIDKNKKRHGSYKSFYRNEKLKEVSNWKYGKRHGCSQTFYVDGSKKKLSNWSNGILIASWTLVYRPHFKTPGRRTAQEAMKS